VDFALEPARAAAMMRVTSARPATGSSTGCVLEFSPQASESVGTMGYRDALTAARQRVEALEDQVAELAEREDEASEELRQLQAQLAQALAEKRDLQKRLGEKEKEEEEPEPVPAPAPRASEPRMSRIRTTLKAATPILFVVATTTYLLVYGAVAPTDPWNLFIPTGKAYSFVESVHFILRRSQQNLFPAMPGLLSATVGSWLPDGRASRALFALGAVLCVPLGVMLAALAFLLAASALLYVLLAAIAIGVVVALVVFIRGTDNQAQTRKRPRKPRR
jgi:hypothetical protein